jgi:ADP-heptose:LPS heptosyltransferase
MSGTPRRIIVLRALQLGDMLCATPALRSLRAAYPQAHVTLLGLPWAKSFATRFPELIDDVACFPGWPGIPEAPVDNEAMSSFFDMSHREPWDLAVQLHGNGLHSNGFIEQIGAQEVAGFCPPGTQRCESGFIPYEDRGPEAERLLRLARHLGWPDAGCNLSFPILDGDWQEYELLREEFGLHCGDYVVVHPGARDPARRWSPEKFAAVADALAEKGLPVLLTGVRDETEQVREVARSMQSQPHIACDRTSLGSLACLLAKSRLLVSNDTGVAHIAEALDVPSVTMFTYSDPERWGAPDVALHRRFVEPSALAGSGGTPIGERRNARPVRVGDVVASALELVGAGTGHAVAA